MREADMEEQQQNEDILSDDHFTITKNIGQMQITQATYFMRVYGNLVGVSTSPWDISLMFAQPITDHPNNIYIEQRVSVTMSLQAAKSLADLLDRTIQSHEQQFGEIKPITPPAQAE